MMILDKSFMLQPLVCLCITDVILGPLHLVIKRDMAMATIRLRIMNSGQSTLHAAIAHSMAAFHVEDVWDAMNRKLNFKRKLTTALSFV